MKTYKIFIASSRELKAERDLLERLIGKKNNELLKKNVVLKAEIWEDMDDSASPTRKQDDYNESLKEAHVVIVLFWTKMGTYTDEEFNIAYELTEDNNRIPRVYLYQKTAKPTFNVSSEDQRSLAAFEKKLNGLVQFSTTFENLDALENAFNKSIDALFNEGYLTHGEPAKLLYTDGHGVPATFIGRKDELEAIREKLDAGGTLLLINAEGGIGKTTLAAKYWEESLYKYKHNAWLFCENGIVESLKKLAPELNVTLTGLNEQQQIEALKRGLLKVHDDLLLVLDNANNPGDLKVFKETFRGFHWHVLVTSRCSGVFEGQEYPVEHLPPPLAKDLFVHYYKENTPGFDALLDRLLKALNYHTLLVEIFSKNMKQWSKFGETLEGLLGHLEGKGLFLEQRSFKITTDYTANVHKEGKNTDAILSILYDFSKLEETERHWLVNMALLPATNRTLVFLVGLFTPDDKYAFGEILGHLAEKGWLISEEDGYRISPVIQQLALKKHQATLWDDGKALVGKLSDLLRLEQDKDNITTKFQWLPISQPMVGIYGHRKDPLFSEFLNNRALVLQELGGEANLLEAKGLLEKALANKIANFGACSVAILTPSWNLFTICNQLKQYPEAVGIIKKIFPISEQHLPDTHPGKGYIKNEYEQIMGAQK